MPNRKKLKRQINLFRICNGETVLEAPVAHSGLASQRQNAASILIITKM